MAKDRLECRIRYVKDFHGWGEHFVFESKWTNEKEWGLDTAFKLLPDENGENNLLSYKALTKIRELQRLGIYYYFAK